MRDDCMLYTAFARGCWRLYICLFEPNIQYLFSVNVYVLGLKRDPVQVSEELSSKCCHSPSRLHFLYNISPAYHRQLKTHVQRM